MKRNDLLAKLQLVAPALAPNDIVPILTHIWFTGSRIMAYNDKIGISAPFKSEFKGAIPGALLINMLKTSAVEEVDLSEDRDALRVKAGGAKLDLAMLPPESFAFKMPAVDKNNSIPLSDKFLAAIQTCMRSVGADTSDPDQLGVTIIPEEKKGVSLFASDIGTLSHVYLTQELNMDKRVILPALFCEQLLALTKEEKAALEIYPEQNYALAIIGGVSLWGRLVASDNPRDFFRVMDEHIPAGAKKKMVEVPAKLEQILERAVLLTETEKSATIVTVKGKTMEFFSRSNLHGHELRDVMTVDGHPEVRVVIDAKHLRSGYGNFGKMLITERCAIMSEDNSYYLVASRGEPPKPRKEEPKRNTPRKQKEDEFDVGGTDDEIPF